MRLRTRFALTFFTAGTITLLALLSVQESVARRLLESRASARAEALAEWLAGAAAPAVEAGETSALGALAAPIAGLPGIQWARVEDASGRALLDWRAPGGASGPAATGASPLKTSYLEGGRAQVGVSTARIDGALQALARKLQAGGLAALAALAALSWGLGAALGRRLEEAVSQIEQVAGCGPGDSNGSEIDRLARALLLLQEAVRRRQSQEAEVAQRRSELADMMVHDLKHPLTVLRMALSVIKEHSAEAATSRAAASYGMAERAVGRLDTMITTLLQLARLQSPDAPLRRERLRLGDFLRACAEENSFVVEQAGRRWTLQVPSELDGALVQADAALLERLIGNLVLNAIDHGKPGDTITLGVRGDERDKTKLELFVTDDGPGLAPEAPDALFGKFASFADSARNVGLGLAFCELAAESHGARMEARANPQGGATFSLRLPASAPQTASLSVRRLGGLPSVARREEGA